MRFRGLTRLPGGGRLLGLLGGLALLGGGLLPAGGCVLAGDLINPQVLAQFGIDPSLLGGESGTIIIVFSNSTGSTATFDYVIERELSSGTLQQSDTKTVIGLGQTNEVLDCPIDTISFTGGSVFPAGAETALTYDGGDWETGQVYECGDVIVITLIETGAGGDDDAAAFDFTVEILPGG